MLSTTFQFIISSLDLGLFAGLAAWDTQKIAALHARDATDKSANIGVLTLYLDFLNPFQFLLPLIGRLKRD